jgi:hypothetical protein
MSEDGEQDFVLFYAEQGDLELTLPSPMGLPLSVLFDRFCEFALAIGYSAAEIELLRANTTGLPVQRDTTNARKRH